MCETVLYPPKKDIDTNFVGNLKNGTGGVVLLINVKYCEKTYTSEELSNVVYSVFDSYIMEMEQSFFTVSDIASIT